jgi:hypothetical protein
MSEPLMAMIDEGLQADPAAVAEAYAALPRLRQQLAAVYDDGEWDAFLTPCAPSESIRHSRFYCNGPVWFC